MIGATQVPKLVVVGAIVSVTYEDFVDVSTVRVPNNGLGTVEIWNPVSAKQNEAAIPAGD